MIRKIKAFLASLKKPAPTPRMPNKLVIVESPYFNEDPDIMLANIEYARACMTDSLIRRESPFLSHLLYTQIMDDTNTDLRELGIDAGLDWGKVAQETIVYTDRGLSSGMKYGIQRAIADGRPITYRSLYKDAAQPSDAVTKHLLDACPDEVKEQLHIGIAERKFEPVSALGTSEPGEHSASVIQEMKDKPPTPETIKQVDRLLGDTIRRTHAFSNRDSETEQPQSSMEKLRQIHQATTHEWTQKLNSEKLKRKAKRGDGQ
ncbi:DUF7768 domain-containing protein [Paraburkholderia aromaticivorans]|uniref:DUF7768 domain-containing protein n=1 Tax=Paraburkholderia aromaticivorans TaxID=2026199 RepID=UPI0038B7A7F8